MIEVNQEKCIKCGACVRDCIVEVLHPAGNVSGAIPVLSPEEERYCLHCQHCMAVCPTGAISVDHVLPEDCPAPGPIPDSGSMLNLLRQRRSVRSYRPESLPPELLAKLKESLRWTPTGCNDHRLMFVMVDSADRMELFRKESSRMLKILIKTGLMRMLYPKYKRYLDEIMNGKDVIFRNAPHMILAATPWNAPCSEADPWIALSYFDLYAQSLGLGTCWCGFGIHALKWNWKMRRALNLPFGYKVGALLLFGRPDVSYARATLQKNFPILTPEGPKEHFSSPEMKKT